ncbi:MAG: hypothetical protein ACK2T5_11705, partial [Anaerolineales bacterium]
MINRQPARLKDIYNLFMGSGMGSRTFAIIQQGNIGAIIDAGPDERRLYLEEAAGVTRYKLRKNEALRKVKSTEQNLLRLNDIIAEVNRQMAGLHRQAKKAEQYKLYQDRIKDIDSRLLLHQYDALNQEIGQTEQLLKSLKDIDISHVTQIKKTDAAVENVKLSRWQKNQEISSQKAEHFEKQRKIDRIESERKHLKDESERLSREANDLDASRIDLISKTGTIAAEVGQIESQNKQLQQEIETIRNQIDTRRFDAQQYQNKLNHLNQQLEKSKNGLMQLVADEAKYKNIYLTAMTNKENLKRRMIRIDEEVALANKKASVGRKAQEEANEALAQVQAQIEELQISIQELKSQLDAKSSQLGASVKETHRLELERNKSRSQLSTMQKMAANFDWYRDGVKAVMQAASPSGEDQPADSPAPLPSQKQLLGISGLMADIIEPEPGYENAVEAVLGEALQYILVADQRSGAAAIEFLQSREAGRCGFIPVSDFKCLPGAESAPNAQEHRLLNHVKITEG